MNEIIKRLRKSRKRWTVMARPKKQPEAPKTDWNLFILLTSFILFLVLVGSIFYFKNESNRRHNAIASEIRKLDDMLLEKKLYVESLERRLALTTNALIDERQESKQRIEDYFQSTLTCQKDVEKLQLQIHEIQEKDRALEKKLEQQNQQSKTKPRVYKRRSGDDGVVRPRVYRWR